MGPSYSAYQYAATAIVFGLVCVAAVLVSGGHPVLLAVGVACLGGAAVLLRPRIEIGDDEVVVRNLRSVSAQTADCITFVPASQPWGRASLLVHEQFEIHTSAPRVFPLMFPWSKELRESFDRRIARLNDELDRRRTPLAE